MNSPISTQYTVTPQWLAAHLNDANIVILDVRMSPVGLTPKRDMQAEFERKHIPGAVYFDIDAIADAASSLPHMLPSTQKFSDAVGKLGISEKNTLVIYDEENLFSAPRAWWTFRIFGAKEVRILDGGLLQWQQAGYPLETGAAKPRQQMFNATFDAQAVKGVNDVRTALDDKNIQILDARPATRFYGKESEPRPGLRCGHIPGSINIPWNEMLHNGHLKSPEALQESFLSHGVDLSRPIITSCGSGITAAILALALHTLNAPQVALYDGSWAEWGASDHLPISI